MVSVQLVKVKESGTTSSHDNFFTVLPYVLFMCIYASSRRNHKHEIDLIACESFSHCIAPARQAKRLFLSEHNKHETRWSWSEITQPSIGNDDQMCFYFGSNTCLMFIHNISRQKRSRARHFRGRYLGCVLSTIIISRGKTSRTIINFTTFFLPPALCEDECVKKPLLSQ